jgi:phenylacetate-CoA ligase
MDHRAEIEKLQLQRLQTLVKELWAGNRFYQKKLTEAGVDEGISSLAAFSQAMPFTSKAEIERDRELAPPYGTNLTYPLDQYSRLCQSSGTSGTPLAWNDTQESWAALLDCWDEVYRAAGVGKADLVFFASSFGPFLGFWTAFESATRSGIPVLPGGGMSSVARLRAMALHGATVLCCTPTYALRLGEVLAAERGDEKLSGMSIRKVIVAGEPGGSIPQVRERLERLWAGARVIDHHGMTEVGPVSYERLDRPMSLCVIEEAYYAEVVDRESLREVGEGEKGELVLTTLRRTACPLLRYRTGDLVEKGYFLDQSGTPGLKILCLEGGILGRVDDMVVVRGINIYPMAIESILLGFPEVAEYQVIHTTRDSMDELEIAIEPVAGTADDALKERVGQALSDALTLRIPVKMVEPGSLPRFEFKARRWVKS